MTSDLIMLSGHSTAYDIGVCKAVGDELERHYPGWQWMVESPSRQGVVRVKSGHMDSRYGFNIRLDRAYSSSYLAKMAIKAGGELLERCGMPRSKYDYDREHCAQNRNLLTFLTFEGTAAFEAHRQRKPLVLPAGVTLLGRE
jgi:hypothetical protein